MRRSADALRVLVVSPSFYPADAYGGPLVSGLALCRALARRGFTLRVLTTDANGRDRLDTRRRVSLERGLEVEYHRRLGLDSVAPGLLFALPRAARWAEAVHLAGVYSFPTIPTLLVARLLGRPLVWSPHGSLQAWSGSRRQTAKSLWLPLCRLAAGTATRLHVTSDQEAWDSARLVPGVPVRVIRHGVEAPGEPLPWSGCTDVRFLFLGRLHPIKGLENLLVACSRVDRELGGRWTLSIAGDGARDYALGLRRLAGELGVADRTTFLGHVSGEARERAFAAADVVVLPSHRENFGMVVAEALARGRPVLVSRSTPWAEVDAEGCGLSTDNSPESLAVAMVRLSRMPLHEMGRRGRDWMLRDFTWARVAEQMESVYVELGEWTRRA